jgi:hypothetical protein
LHRRPRWCNVYSMKRHRFLNSRKLLLLYGLVLLGAGARRMVAEPPAQAVAAFNLYIDGVELRLDRQHRSRDGFLAPLAADSQTGLRRGELVIQQLTPSNGGELPGALLHHWRGTAFAAGAKAADFERLMKDFNSYPRHFSPQVIQAKVVVRKDDRMQAVMRVRQRHVITVVMDTAYDVNFGQLDAQHGYSVSRSTRISEIDSAGTANERVLNADEEHGFLWRQNTYWSYEERDGGLYMQIESISLTRSIPAIIGWAVRPFVESVPRESLEFTLRATCNALRR